jgi:acetyl esterase/lipase
VRAFESQPVNPHQTVEEMRREFEQLGSFSPLPADIRTEATDAGGVKAEWIAAPGTDAGRAILYLLGGGYVMGSIDNSRELAGRISRAARARVLLIEYRLAPEHPFPAALDDSLAAYRWMLASGADPARVAVAGDSAGGGLVVATLVAIKEAKLARPAAGVCMSPWVDLELTGESMTTKATVDHLVGREDSARKSANVSRRKRSEDATCLTALRRPFGTASTADPRWHFRDAARRR